MKIVKILEKEDYIKGIITILNFLALFDDEFEEIKDFATPSNVSMMKVLDGFDHTIVTFTKELNGGFAMWNESPKEFFSDHDKSMKYFSKKLQEYLDN